MNLPLSDRLSIGSRLLDTVPPDFAGLCEDDEGFLDELKRRAKDDHPTIPASEFWPEE